jgi:hypothetical protein
MVTETPQDMTSEGKGWLVTVDGEAFGGSYAMKLLFVPDVVASKMTKGQRYALVLQQQIVRNRQDGTPHDGEKDWMYFWKVERFAESGDTIPQTPVPAASEAPATASWSSTASIDERIAWNSAINNAVTAVGLINDGLPPPLPSLEYWVAEVDRVAQSVFALIRRGPTPPEEGVYDESAQQLSDGITGESPF